MLIEVIFKSPTSPPQASRTAATPNATPTAAAAGVEEPSAPPPPPFDEAVAVETLKSLVNKALEDLPSESPSTSQRSTPEPGSVSVGILDQESAVKKTPTRDQVLEGQ